MQLLLDTHVWLWWFLEPRRLSDRAKGLIAGDDHTLLFSAASSLEIALKYALKKLKLPEAPARFVPDRIARHAMTPLPIQHSHALRVSELPRHHSDPFDRLLIAQAQLEPATILTADPSFILYEVDILWAGTGEPPSLVSEWNARRTKGRRAPVRRRRAGSRRGAAHPK